MFNMKSNFSRWLVCGIVSAFIVGIIMGFVRYWAGCFILFCGVVAGYVTVVFSSILVGSICISKKEFLKTKTFRMVLAMFIVFIIGELLGFGLAQPWFDPIGFFGRVVAGRTSEMTFVVGMTGGIIGKHFIFGVNKGFWVFLNMIDILFMLFFMLITLNIKMEKHIAKDC